MQTAVQRIMKIARDLLDTYDDPGDHAQAVLRRLKRNKALLAAYQKEVVPIAVQDLVYDVRHEEHRKFNRSRAAVIKVNACPRSLAATKNSRSVIPSTGKYRTMGDYKMPNGKRLRDCTFDEVRAAIEWAQSLVNGWNLDIAQWSAVVGLRKRGKKMTATVGACCTDAEIDAVCDAAQAAA